MNTNNKDNNLNKKYTIGDCIENFLRGTKKGVATLKEIYVSVQAEKPTAAKETIRCAIYRDKKNRFKPVAKGIYMVIGKKSTSLLIQGDSRGLNELEEKSVDAIITDHPWELNESQQSGNQKDFANYEKFIYTLDDMKAKARVLKDGGYLAEFLPVESATNYEYLYKIKRMAKEAGLNYYAKITWKKDEQNKCNTGRTKKGIEDICIFYKGRKPRRLSRPRVAYSTKEMLLNCIDIPAHKGKAKAHQAEKNIEVYEYLIEMLTEEVDVLLDQFGGSCNMMQAAINKNRFAIVYEKSKEFIKKAVDRLGCITLFEEDNYIYEDVEVARKDKINNTNNHVESGLEIIDVNSEESILEQTCLNEVVLEKAEIPTENVDELTLIESQELVPSSATEFQLNFLNNIRMKKSYMLNPTDLGIIEKANKGDGSVVLDLSKIFNRVLREGYSNYNTPVFDLSLSDYIYVNEMETNINQIFDTKFPNKHIKDFYLNYKIEARSFTDYCLVKKGILDFSNILKNSKRLIQEYIVYLKENCINVNWIKSEKLLTQFFA